MIFDDNIAEAPIGRPRLTWSGTSSKSARPANDFESCETVSIAESAQCPLVRPPAQLLLLSSRRSRTKTDATPTRLPCRSLTKAGHVVVERRRKRSESG